MKAKDFLRKPLKIFQSLLGIFGFQLVSKKELQDFYLYQYESYDDYRNEQIFHNRRKIAEVWADKETLNRVSNIVSQERTGKIYGLCHGSRNGFEQNYLNSLGNGIFAIGTDISDTAVDFPNSVMWDFHEVNPDWIEKFDFVYTNSLDQSWRPQEALRVWIGQLKIGGLLVIEHTRMHEPAGASKMDPFGVKPEVFPYYLTLWFGNEISISHSKAKKANKNLDAWLFVLQKLR